MALLGGPTFRALSTTSISLDLKPQVDAENEGTPTLPYRLDIPDATKLLKRGREAEGATLWLQPRAPDTKETLPSKCLLRTLEHLRSWQQYLVHSSRTPTFRQHDALHGSNLSPKRYTPPNSHGSREEPLLRLQSSI